MQQLFLSSQKYLRGLANTAGCAQWLPSSECVNGGELMNYDMKCEDSPFTINLPPSPGSVMDRKWTAAA